MNISATVHIPSAYISIYIIISFLFTIYKMTI